MVRDLLPCSLAHACIGPCTKDDWLAVATPAIQKRIERYSRSEIRFNLLAIIKNRKTQFVAEVTRLESENEKLKNKVCHTLLFRSAVGKRPQGPDSMEVDNPEARIAANTAAIADLQRRIAIEDDKFRSWRVRCCTHPHSAEFRQTENIRRKHNYIPFLVNLLKLLAEKGELVPLINKAKEKQGSKGAK